MDRKEINKRMEDIHKELAKLAAPKDPNQAKRNKLVNELDRLHEMEQNHFSKAIKETRKLLSKDIKELEAMCKRQFDAVIPVKAKVRVRLETDATDLHTYNSTCGVQIEFPKDRRKLSFFTLDDEENLSSAGIHIVTAAKGLLPELDGHLKKLVALHAKVMKSIKEEAKRHGIQKIDMDDFVGEVMSPS